MPSPIGRGSRAKALPRLLLVYATCARAALRTRTPNKPTSNAARAMARAAAASKAPPGGIPLARTEMSCDAQSVALSGTSERGVRRQLVLQRCPPRQRDRDRRAPCMQTKQHSTAVLSLRHRLHRTVCLRRGCSTFQERTTTSCPRGHRRQLSRSFQKRGIYLP